MSHFLRKVPIVASLTLLLCAVDAPKAKAAVPPGFAEQEVGSLWTEPVGVAFDSDPRGANRVYVWERAGRIWILENGVNSWVPLLDIRDEVGAWRDYGMLGFALDPAFQENGYIYVSYVVDRHHLLHAGTASYDPAANEYLAATIGRVTRYTARASDGRRTVDPASRKVLIGETASTGIPILHGSHGPGHLVFGTDGTLLVASGDAASWEGMDDGGPDGNSYAAQGIADGIIPAKEDVGAFRAQLVDSLNGKILRLDPSTGDGVASNPFFDPAKPRAAKSRVWALGLRNPYRFTVRPESGSHVPAEASPGVIVLGDVGWETHEDVHVIDGPGQNCGWPLFEGLTSEPTFAASPAENADAPNPLGGFFKFRDLLVQETRGTPSWPNPRDPSQQVPPSIPRFMHRRPVIDVGRDVALGGPARAATFSGDNATETKIGAPGSPVAGSQFLANTSTGGVFYTGNDFPAAYRGTYFHADYGQRWIKNIIFDANQQPVQVNDFATDVRPVFLATHPSEGALYYVDMTIPVIRKIVYAPGGNRPPVAAASANVFTGSSPLAVQFSSAGSSDPDGQAITYGWDFGDGTTSTAANPAHTFTATGTRRLDVRLVVTDSAGGTAQASIAIFVNHTLPVVQMISPIDGTKYPLLGDTNYRLTRRVVEAPGHPTTSVWKVLLVHNNHEHGEPSVTAPETTAALSPVYSATESYSYRIALTVTDDLGAIVERTVQLFPNATNAAPQVGWSASSQTRNVFAGAVILDAAATASDPDSVGIEAGVLTVTSSTPAALSIVPAGDGAGEVNVNGSSVLFEGENVGVLSVGASTLSVTFNDAAARAAAQAILRRVAANFTTAGQRTITATLSDGDGGTSGAAALAINVLEANQPPTVTLTSPVNGASFTAPATVALNVTAGDPDGSVTKVEFLNGAVKIGEVTTAPFAFSWSGVAAGEYSLTARATDDRGAVSISASVGITVAPPVANPATWQARDIGGAVTPGSATFSGGRFTATAAGRDFVSGSDQFQFISQPWTGDGDVIARIDSIQLVSSGTSGGVMFREAFGAKSRFVSMQLTAGSGARMRSRAEPGAVPTGRDGPDEIAPHWVKLSRRGSRFTGWISADGAAWSLVGIVVLPLASECSVGLATSAGNSPATDPATTTTVVYSGISLGLPANEKPAVLLSSPPSGAAFTLEMPVIIEAIAGDPRGSIPGSPFGSIKKVELFNYGARLEGVESDQALLAWKPGAGNYSVTALATGFGGSTASSAPAVVSVSAAAGVLPAPWQHTDLAPVASVGSAAANGDLFTLSNAGSAAPGTTDQMHFVYQPWTGDGVVMARLLSIPGTAPEAFAGVSFRESLAPDARHAMVAVRARFVTGFGVTKFTWRGRSGKVSKSIIGPEVGAPRWLKLVRKGTRFSGFISADGTTWRRIWRQTIAMGQSAYVGAVTCSGDANKPSSVVFQSFQVGLP